jgi:hypothetical protein
VADFPKIRWYLRLWLRLTQPISLRLIRPTRGTRELNAAVAARLNPLLPEGCAVTPLPGGRLGLGGPGAGGGVAGAALHLPLPRRWRLRLAGREQLKFYRLAAGLRARDPDWPAPGARGHARVSRTELRLWFTDGDGHTVLTVPPIPRSELGL